MINPKTWKAAFLMKDGRIISTGTFHDANLLPNGTSDLENLADKDGGFVDQDGRYYSRAEAKAIVNSNVRVESQDLLPQSEPETGVK